ncbi:hypothetical protein BU26DRAFT_524198 [Trematosphaeria pertusa]|uniref:Uncharacterized protein n=1 Tax=Trematosphaeria pertusa TaxID=390896 RepID=A0A6A6HXI6_9PLEO|nr:uncharacterized protein BU26DRAFT_524198 [Trematosphaeria pertusa]KAF2242599.1 hypothetical protein BU26DRAFT_524198 [Trematosphaeria pertusa]
MQRHDIRPDSRCYTTASIVSISKPRGNAHWYLFLLRRQSDSNPFFGSCSPASFHPPPRFPIFPVRLPTRAQPRILPRFCLFNHARSPSAPPQHCAQCRIPIRRLPTISQDISTIGQAAKTPLRIRSSYAWRAGTLFLSEGLVLWVAYIFLVVVRALDRIFGRMRGTDGVWRGG